MAELPGSVLFCCTLNALRSPMAEAMLKHLHGRRIFVDSVGVRAGALDEFAIAVMDEIGLDIGRHKPQTFEELEDLEGLNFDVIITLTPEAHHRALELTRVLAVDVEYWPTPDPTDTQGNREQRLDAYRAVRDQLFARVKARFAPAAGTGNE